MSDFYSRCLWCNLDLPRGLAFCTPTHREWWTRQHNREPVAKTLTDEIGNADVRERSSAERITVPCGEGRSDTTGGQDDSVACPTVRSLASEREVRLRNADHRYCQCPKCRTDVI